MRPPQRTSSPDDFQTPAFALDPLYPHLRPGWTIWEPACGQGLLVKALESKNYKVIGSDILTGKDFLRSNGVECDCIITNPPYSLKEDFLIRCYALEKPFALLLPITSLEGQDRQRLFDENGVEILLFDKRINFVTPEGMKASGSWFATAWFTWGLNIGRQLTFPQSKGPKQQVLEVC